MAGLAAQRWNQQDWSWKVRAPQNALVLAHTRTNTQPRWQVFVAAGVAPGDASARLVTLSCMSNRYVGSMSGVTELAFEMPQYTTLSGWKRSRRSDCNWDVGKSSRRRRSSAVLRGVCERPRCSGTAGRSPFWSCRKRKPDKDKRPASRLLPLSREAGDSVLPQG